MVCGANASCLWIPLVPTYATHYASIILLYVLRPCPLPSLRKLSCTENADQHRQAKTWHADTRKPVPPPVPAIPPFFHPCCPPGALPFPSPPQIPPSALPHRTTPTGHSRTLCDNKRAAKHRCGRLLVEGPLRSQLFAPHPLLLIFVASLSLPPSYNPLYTACITTSLNTNSDSYPGYHLSRSRIANHRSKIYLRPPRILSTAGKLFTYAC